MWPVLRTSASLWKRFESCGPSDRELIAEDIYRKHLYRTAETIQQRMVIAPAVDVRNGKK